MMDKDKVVEETTQILAAIGSAISEWSFVELSLCNLFTICVIPCPMKREPDGYLTFIDSEVPTATFYAIESFRGKLNLADAAIRARLKCGGDWTQQVLDDWSRLYGKVRKLSLQRNKLAHWTVMPAQGLGDDFSGPKLMPPYGSPGWWTETSVKPDGKSMKLSDVEQLWKAFQLIDEKVRDFYKEFAQRPELIDIYDQLTVRLIRTHDRLDPTRGERIRRDLSSHG